MLTRGRPRKEKATTIRCFVSIAEIVNTNAKDRELSVPEYLKEVFGKD